MALTNRLKISCYAACITFTPHCQQSQPPNKRCIQMCPALPYVIQFHFTLTHTIWFVITLCVETPSGDCSRFEAPVKSKCMTEDDQSDESALLDEEESLLVTNRLHQVLRPFMLRRLKESVAKELPQKVHQLL